MQWIREASANAERVMAVCTGTVLLGMTGVLDGRKATTNKLDFAKTVPLAPKVDSVKEDRWVEYGKFFLVPALVRLAAIQRIVSISSFVEFEFYWSIISRRK